MIPPTLKDVVHFIGIGGIGMSAIAEIMQQQSFQVQGSDTNENENVQRLRKKNIPVFVGHDARHVVAADHVVYSSAIGADNVERVAAAAKKIPLWHRADMLAMLMRAKKSITITGSHGKTTTTALIAALLDEAGFDPTVINGGIIHAYKSNVRFGKSDWIIVEADESDGSFAKLPAHIAVVTNMDYEHLAHYGSFDRLRAAFADFVARVADDGAVVLCADYAETRALADKTRATTITYGLGDADITAEIISTSSAGVHFKMGSLDMNLALPGRHNVQNMLAAIAVARILEIAPEIIARGLAKFAGVARRFSLVGQYKGVQVYDDYAHHPAEIAATLATAKQIGAGKVIAIVQPHRFSRLADLFDAFTQCFADADLVILTPVYAAGEKMAAVDHQTLGRALCEQGKQVIVVARVEEMVAALNRHGAAGDIAIGMGAGSIGTWMKEMVDAER